MIDAIVIGGLILGALYAGFSWFQLLADRWPVFRAVQKLPRVKVEVDDIFTYGRRVERLEHCADGEQCARWNALKTSKIHVTTSWIEDNKLFITVRPHEQSLALLSAMEKETGISS